MTLAHEIARGLLDLVFPPFCMACERELTGSPEIALCGSCEPGLIPVPRASCEQCGKLFRQRSPSHPTCWECRSGRRGFDNAVCVYVYRDTFRKLWHRIKFERHLEFLDPVVAHASKRIPAEAKFNPYSFDVYTWVPSSPARKASRGFDPAEEVARRLAAMYQRPCHELLKRVRDSRPQFELDRSARQKNVDGAFEAFVPRDVRTRRVLLIDDILTTGATATACARALKSRDCGDVTLFALSRGL